MVAINMLAFNYIGMESISMRVQCFPIIDLLATFLNAFLLPLYTMKESQNISEYYTLPAGKKYFIGLIITFNSYIITLIFVYPMLQSNLYSIGFKVILVF